VGERLNRRTRICFNSNEAAASMRAAHYTYGVQGRIVYTVCSTHRVINPNVKASRRVAIQIGIDEVQL
jgi:hypothetical protein